MRRRSFFVALAALSLVLAACGGSSNSGSNAGGSPAEPKSSAVGTAAPAGTGTAVSVALGETSTQKMYMNLDTTTVPGGPVTFTIKNEGSKTHEFVVLRTDTMAADIPIESNDEINEDTAGKNVGESGDIDPGESQTLSIDLPAGHYALVCNIKGHVRMGMINDLTVT